MSQEIAVLRDGKLGLAPSSLVDTGVHTVILDTVAHAELCEQFNEGRFLHHVPWADAAACGPCHPGNDSH